MAETPHVVVAGGGFAGLEAAFYLRWKLGDKVRLTLVSDRDHFVFKPNTIYIPFGEEPERFRIELERPCRKRNIERIEAEAQGVEPEARKLETSAGAIDYDWLVIATGAAMRPEEVPGLRQYAHTLWTIEDMLALRAGLERVLQCAKEGKRQRLLFLVPPNNKCSGPLYEMVFMTDTWLRKQGARDAVEITWTTMEQSFIQAFGPRLHTVVSEEFRERGITGRTGMVVEKVLENEVVYRGEQRLPYDLLVSFPPYAARVRWKALPSDDRGFVHVEPDSRRVREHQRIFCAGDAADFPIKQAFLALLQADAAADHIAAAIAGTEPELRFEPMSMCVMEELNKATFAQVPLKYTDDPERPVVADAEDTEHYKVGVSPLWRLGKKVLGIYLPWRFGAGKPFHAGFAWEAMDMGLKVMSKVLAD
ncbi:MAG: NAD(P)/FAD-dependent oxidoreductase [Planctomycetota bacterium]|nr:MAG: NAD(P)/FAD-dependent oxidoreductase [Planctomycetota bacterium]